VGKYCAGDKKDTLAPAVSTLRGLGAPSPRRSDASGAEACATIAYRAHCDQGTKATAIKRVSERERKYGIVYTLTLHTLRHRRRTDYRPRMPALSSLLTFACSESVEHHRISVYVSLPPALRQAQAAVYTGWAKNSAATYS